MKFARTAPGVAVVVAAAVVTPASAGLSVSPTKIAEVASATMRPLDVYPILGIPGAHTFDVRNHAKTNPWICLTDRRYVARKTEVRYRSNVVLAGSNNPIDVTQHVWVYNRATFAAHSFGDVVRKARHCWGVWKIGDWEGSGGPLYRQRLHHGRTVVQSHGKRGVWVAANMEVASAVSTWAEDEYSVYFRVGHTLQSFDYDIGPEHPSGVSMRLRKAVDRLAWRMAQRWNHRLGPHWH